MKYIKAFLAWLVGVAVIAGIASVVVPPLPFFASDADPQGITNTIINLVVVIGMGIWVRRLLKSGAFGD